MEVNAAMAAAYIQTPAMSKFACAIQDRFDIKIVPTKVRKDFREKKPVNLLTLCRVGPYLYLKKHFTCFLQSVIMQHCQAQLQLKLQLQLELSLDLVPLNPATHPPADRESIF